MSFNRNTLCILLTWGWSSWVKFVLLSLFWLFILPSILHFIFCIPYPIIMPSISHLSIKVIACVGDSGTYKINFVTFRYNGEAGSDGLQVLTPYVLCMVTSFKLSELSDSCFLYLKGQMLTLVEYMLLLYRALLPKPVWYWFFLNKDYGSLFSSLTNIHSWEGMGLILLYMCFSVLFLHSHLKRWYTSCTEISWMCSL